MTTAATSAAAPQVRRPDPEAAASRLRIGGLTRLTTIDYPGELAAVVFCHGCSWRCRYCHNGHLLDTLDNQLLLPWSEVRDFLRQRRGLLDAVVFSGGEPTLQGALAAAMTETRELGYRIGLHTAGPAPERLARLLPLIDWVALDIKGLPEDYAAITGVPGSGERAWESLRLLLDAGLPHEVRTTLMPDWTAAKVAQLAHRLADAGVRHYSLQSCDPSHALDPHLERAPQPLAELAAAIQSARFASLTLRGH